MPLEQSVSAQTAINLVAPHAALPAAKVPPMTAVRGHEANQLAINKKAGSAHAESAASRFGLKKTYPSPSQLGANSHCSVVSSFCSVARCTAARRRQALAVLCPAFTGAALGRANLDHAIAHLQVGHIDQAELLQDRLGNQNSPELPISRIETCMNFS